MRVAQWRLAVALVMVAMSAGARAQAPEGAAPLATVAGPGRYPLALRVIRSEEARAATFDHRRGRSFDPAPFPDARVPVGDQALAAYVRLAAERFASGSGGAADATLEVEAVSPGLSQDAEGWRAAVHHRLVLRSAAGEVLGRWEVKGEARIPTTSAGALALGFSRAATQAAARFEYEVEEPPGVAAWLQARGVAPGTLRPARPPPVLEQAPLFPVPPGANRAPRVAYLDLALVLSGADRFHVGGGLRLGVETSNLFVQGRWQAARWAQEQHGVAVGPAYGFASTVVQWQAALEGGLVVRPASFVELRAGPGIAWLSARLLPYYRLGNEPTPSDSRLAPTFMAALQATTGVGTAGRFRMALELRKTVGGTLTFRRGSSDATAVEVADLEAALLVGFELP